MTRALRCAGAEKSCLNVWECMPQKELRSGGGAVSRNTRDLFGGGVRFGRMHNETAGEPKRPNNFTSGYAADGFLG
jgi:hypothetical protein